MTSTLAPRAVFPADPVPADEVAAAAAAGIPTDNVGFSLLQLIRSYGVDTVFGIPGTHNLELYRHLKRLRMRAVTTRHEQGAGYAADGWSQRTGLPGVVITTSGPGLLNALSAAGTAYCESRPLLLISPGPARGSEFADIGALHETKDQLAAAGAIVEWARRAQTETEALAAIHDAFLLFRSGRPRPVYLEVPLDLLESASTASQDQLRPAPVPEPVQAAAGDLAAAAAALHAARRPAILAGGGAITGAAALRELAELLGAPVVTSLNGKGVLPESHPLALGAQLRLDTTRTVLNTADVLLVVGSKIGESELWGGTIAPGGSVLRVDISADQTNKNLAATHPLIGDAAAVLPQLLHALQSLRTGAGPAPDWSPGSELASQLDEVRAAALAEGAAFAPVEDALASRIAAALPANAIVAGDSSQITYYGMTSRVQSEEPHAFLYMAAYATLGYGLPAAIGAKIADPDRPVIGVLGDGALMFSVQEFQTAVEQGIDLTIVCVDNGGYGEIKQNEADRGISPVGVTLHQPDWPTLVTAFGGTGFAVQAADQLEATLARALAQPGVTLVHVPLALFG